MTTKGGATKDGDNEHMSDQARTIGNGRQKEVMGPGRQGQAIGTCWCVSLGWNFGE